jgi:hypothetical protein
MPVVRVNALSKAFLEHVITQSGADIVGRQPWEKDAIGVLLAEQLIEADGRRVVVTPRGLRFFERAAVEMDDQLHVFYMGDPESP